MTRAITSPELTKLRGNEQWSELYLAFDKPAVVFAARVNHTFASSDDISQCGYDGVTTGAYTDVLPGMTCYVGSTAGAHDLGMVRIRKAPSTTMIYFGETSDVRWADNVYLTVVDEFNLWARHWYQPSGNVTIMDRDIPYTDQNTNFYPVPIMGPYSPIWLTGASVTFSPPLAADSWVIGSTITGYNHSLTGPAAVSVTGATTATPTFTITTAGTYLYKLTVTAANGKSSTGYRKVYVFDKDHMPVSAFTLENCAGDHEAGGWSFTVTLYDEAALADVRERAKVILFAKDTYGGAAGSIGPLAGYENIICEGWIDEESIDWDAEQGAVHFTVRGAWYWLGKLAAYSGGLKNTTTTSADWRLVQNLTTDKALHNLLYWRSTCAAVMDCYLSGDTRTTSALMVSPGTLWGQLKEIGSFSFMYPTCDRFGRLFIEIDSQFLPVASRASLPVVQAITKADWTDRIRIPRRTTNELAQVETGGADLTKPYYSRSYGLIPGRYGTIESKDNLLVSDQADLNAVTGMLVAQRNNPYPNIGIKLAANNRMMDICPRQYVTLTIAAGDTERGLVWTDERLIPRRVIYSHEADTGALTAELECEAETSGAPGIMVIPPKPPSVNYTPPDLAPLVPNFPLVPYPNINIPPQFDPGGGPDAPGTPCRDGTDPSANGPYNMYASGILEAGQEMFIDFPFYARPGDATNPSSFTLQVRGERYDQDLGWIPDSTILDGLSIELVDEAGNSLGSGAFNTHVETDGEVYTGSFSSLPAGTDVAGVVLKLAGSPIYLSDITISEQTNITAWVGINVLGELTKGIETGYGVGAIGQSISYGAQSGFPAGTRQGLNFAFASPVPMLLRAIGTCLTNSTVDMYSSGSPTQWTYPGGGGWFNHFDTTFLVDAGAQTVNFKAETYCSPNAVAFDFFQALQVEVWASSAARVIVSSGTLWNICGHS